jgi:FKBP-type peptidyl-prolyl cis-trans isomerase
MKIKFWHLISLVILGGCILYGCSRFSGYEEASNGLYYKFHRHTDGVKPVIGQVATINLTYSLGDSLMFNSVQLNEPMNLVLSKPVYQGDVNDAILMLCLGDSASFLTRADSFFYKTMNYNRLPKGVDEDSKVRIEIGLAKIQTESDIKKQTEEWENTLKANEPIAIAEFIKNSGATYDSTAEGLYVLVSAKGTGPTIQPGNIVSLDFAIHTVQGKKLYSTWEAKKPFKLEYGKKFDTEGFNIALKNMSKGTKARLVIPSRLAFGKEGRPGFIRPYEPLLYDVEILAIQTKEDIEKEKLAAIEAKKAAETRQIVDYVKRNGITAQPMANGLYVVETKKGNGPAVVTGKKVLVQYSGYLLNGTKFDSSLDRGQPFEFVVGKGNVIKGWDEGIKLLKVGSKAKLVIPSSLAYGEAGSGEKIPPFSPLMFEIEILGIE